MHENSIYIKQEAEFNFQLKLDKVVAHDMKEHSGVEVQIHSFLTLALDGGEWSNSRPFTPGRRSLWGRDKSRFPARPCILNCLADRLAIVLSELSQFQFHFQCLLNWNWNKLFFHSSNNLLHFKERCQHIPGERDPAAVTRS